MNQLLDWAGQQKGNAILLSRVVMGVILIVAGYGKLFGVGIDGFSGFLASKNVPLAPLFGFLVPILEFFGGILITLGVASRLLCIWVIVQFFLITVYIKPVLLGGDWGGTRIDLVLFTLGILILTNGAGPLALGPKILPGKRWAE